ncbi:MAG: beta-N-acetylhexosaminidase [Bacteroidales bacterium]|nr:beta-N-acetylhexosaminidase [Bacteroidales bacterium]
MKRFLILLTLAAALVSCAKKVEISIIPQPASIEAGTGVYALDDDEIYIQPGIDPDGRLTKAVKEFAAQLGKVSEKDFEIDDEPDGEGFSFILEKSLAPESYELVSDKKGVTVKASDFNGFFYAIQTLKQLLPVEFFGDKSAPGVKWVIPAVTIKDAPRFAYRGMHLDPCRHFWSVEETKKYLDVMALHKLNRLHWHITEDQGWRIEIKKYPLLTEIGSVRKGTIVGGLNANLEFEKEHGYMETDGIPYGGFYTQEQAREIVQYAWDRGITVIPEIDLPGHMLGALAAYPQLGCTGGPYEVWTRWGVSEDVLCPGKDAMFTFLEDVFSELIDIFPSEYIHIGGDECPKTAWQKCPACQKRIKALGLVSDDKATKEQRLQNYVTARVQKFLSDRGRKIIGWDEILEGELAPGATVMSWRGTEGGIAAAGAGFDAIMTPNTYCYFDYYQSDKPETEPFAIGGCLPLDKVYSYDPVEGIPAEAQSHILGAQANMWTEYISETDHLEYMLLPRLDALSEVQWCAPEQKDYSKLLCKLQGKMFPIYDLLGYTYCRTAFGQPGLHE